MKCLRILLSVLMCCILAGGCATTQSGNFVRTNEVNQLVESATVLPGHTYYFTGPKAEPDAIIAIDNKFTLQSKYWIKVDDVATQLNDWNRVIDNAHRVPGEHGGSRGMSPSYQGARIMTPEGEQAGIWYSRHYNTVIQFPDPATIVLYAPAEPVSGERRSPRR